MPTPLEKGYVFPGQPGAKKVSGRTLRRYARAYGLPARAMSQIAKGESNRIMNVQQPDPGDGMVGYTTFQFTPNAWGEDSAAMKKWRELGGARGVRDDLDKQFEMARFLYKSAGNSLKPWYGTRYLTDRTGEGSLGPVNRDLIGGLRDRRRGAARQESRGLDPATAAPAAPAGPDKTAFLQQYVMQRDENPNALLDLVQGLATAENQPQQAQEPRSTKGPVDPTRPRRNGPQGATKALGWAESKLGKSEATGANDGKLPGRLNRAFGMSNQPWCAMFTSFAVTKGGAPSIAKTASVEQVRRKAESKQGYHGFVKNAKAKPGDLILFGNDHIAMVRSVSNGKINYVGGNQSNAVTHGSVSVGDSVDIVRPKYKGF